MQRVKILFNKKDTALIQFTDCTQSSTGEFLLWFFGFFIYIYIFRKNKSLQIAKLKNSKTWTKTNTQTDKTGQHI